MTVDNLNKLDFNIKRLTAVYFLITDIQRKPEVLKPDEAEQINDLLSDMTWSIKEELQKIKNAEQPTQGKCKVINIKKEPKA